MRSEQNVDCLFFFAQFILLPILEQIKTTPSVLLYLLLSSAFLFLCISPLFSSLSQILTESLRGRSSYFLSILKP